MKSLVFMSAVCLSLAMLSNASAVVVGYNVKYTITGDVDTTDGRDFVGEEFFGMVFVDPTVDDDPFPGVQSNWNPLDPNTSDARLMASFFAIGADWDSDTDDFTTGGTFVWPAFGPGLDGIIFGTNDPFNSWQLTHAAFTNTFDLRFGNQNPVSYSGTVEVTLKTIVPEPATATLGLLAFGGLMLRRRRVA